MENKLRTCLPKAFPVFFNLMIHFTLLVLGICFIWHSFIASFLNPSMCPLFFCHLMIFLNLLHPLNVPISNAVSHRLLVFNSIWKKTHHNLIYFLHQPLSLWHAAIAIKWETKQHIGVILMPAITFQKSIIK